MGQVKVGVGILVVQNGQLLLGKRINVHGHATWAPPGGHLEYGESPVECAARELKEETSLVATHIVPGPWTNDFFEVEKKQYLSVFMIVKAFDGIPRVIEPEKCSCWRWFDFDALPQPLFLSLSQLLKTHSLSTLVNPRPTFAVIYRGYVKPDREQEYIKHWNCVAHYFVKERGALGSTLHKTADNMWVAYSRWPNQESRDASWPLIGENSPIFVRHAIEGLKACLDSEKQLPEISMSVVDEISHHERTPCLGEKIFTQT